MADMAATTRTDFDANTEALAVAKEFASQVRGKTILVTGANRDGIGFATLQALASQAPAQLILTGRSSQKIQQCIDALKMEFPDVSYYALHVDLSNQRSVRSAATEFLGWSDVSKVDILINNAAVMGVQDRTLTDDGIELHFATNHVGHFLFASLIMPKIMAAAKDNPKGATRIVNVSSLSPTVSSIRWSDINFEKKNGDLPDSEKTASGWFEVWGYTDIENTKYIPLDGYDRSKVANVLFGISLNQRLYDKYGILSLAVHPGVIVGTELARNFPRETLASAFAQIEAGHFNVKTVGAGASTSLVAALDPKLANGVGQSKNGSENWGAYLLDCQISDQASSGATSSKLAERLWDLSEKLVGEKFSW